MGCESTAPHVCLRLLFTATLTVTLTAFAFWSDSYSVQLSDSWRNWLGFSSLSLPELRWHQTLTSLVLTAGERQFVQSILMLCISVGMCEWHFGSRPAIKVFFASHLIVTVGLALFFVLPLHLGGAGWATALASERDVGPSAGYYGCLGAVLTSLKNPQRTYLICVVMVILIGRLAMSSVSIHLHPSTVSADLSHIAAFPLGMLLTYAGFSDPGRRVSASQKPTHTTRDERCYVGEDLS